jgi:hypothetical protein
MVNYKLSNIPERYRTYEICIESVEKNGLALMNVPKKHRTHDLCMAAVKDASLSDEVCTG